MSSTTRRAARERRAKALLDYPLEPTTNIYSLKLQRPYLNRVMNAYINGKCSLIAPIPPKCLSNKGKRKVQKDKYEKMLAKDWAEYEKRRDTPIGIRLPANRVYQEPDREPVDRMAASMFWGEPKI